MQAIADTHLHLYPNYDIEAAFTHFLDRVKIQNQQQRIACLAERHDCQFFESIRSGKTTLTQYELVASSEKELQLVSIETSEQFTLLPGRQVISAENIEVLALACPVMVKDGQPAADIIRQVNQHGGLAVVAWSPGKWFFSRGKVVTQLLQDFSSNDFVIGDTTLRPYGWLLPSLMKKAKNLGFTVIAGSDPLPFAGEEAWYGAYTSQIQGEADNASELIVGLKTGVSVCQANSGTRSWPWQLLQRLRANAASK